MSKDRSVESPLREVPDGKDGDTAIVEDRMLVTDAHLLSCAQAHMRTFPHEQDS